MKAHYACSTLCLILLCLLSAGTSSAEGKFGIGVVFGEPTGVAWKYRINYINAIDGSIGFSPYDRARVNIDFLWHSHPFNGGQLALHYGVGSAFGFGRTDFIAVRGNDGYFLRRQELGFGVRAVIGLTYDIPRSPVDLFFELAPILVLTPGTGMGIDVGVGARIYP